MQILSGSVLACTTQLLIRLTREPVAGDCVFPGVTAHCKKKVIVAVHGGLAQKASVCLFRRREKSIWGAYLMAKRRRFNTKVIDRERRRSYKGSDALRSLLCGVYSIDGCDFAPIWGVYGSHVCESCVSTYLIKMMSRQEMWCALYM
jgi:hypothetical protein